ncbi:MAG TPA: DUF1501 domain-containing protein [Humisphaera sp.]|jgi:hypothetical protein|nr:DUF1501 domain-containing protein [Humisphaera sp.]
MQDIRSITRRHLFGQCALGLGSIALASLLNESSFGAQAPAPAANPLSPRQPHFRARAKNVIYLFMAGGPSQLELFDYKPKLIELNGTPIPDSYIAGKRFAFMDSSFKNRSTLMGTRRQFARHGRVGAWVSELMPHTATIVDDITMVHTLATDVFNHAPAKLFMNTGSSQTGRPSMGAWITYGIGSECNDLPGFVVLQSGPRGPRGGAANWTSGFLPSTYQGVPFRSTGDPIVDLSTPAGIDAQRQRETVDAVRALNLKRLVATGDPEISTRIAAYEMAYRMQTSAPQLIDLSGETPATIDLYGATPGKPSFANNCLLARRLVERGVRFIQLYHTNWDSHGGPGENLQGDFEKLCRETDQGAAALVKDLKQRGLLDDTLVVWGGEFGRTPMGENRNTTGRNHHIDCATAWLAGGGVKAGFTFGQTDELGFAAAEDPMHVHDLHATMLHLLGLEHTKLTYRFQGRDFRLTDVAGKVVQKILA